MTKKITLIDYGLANLLNVARAFEYCGVQVKITNNPAEVKVAERLVVPGVGAFQDCMLAIKTQGFSDALQNYFSTERPFLGICVGMQILFDVSEEFGEYPGLGVLPGRVVSIPKTTVQGETQRVPHIGWNNLVPPQNRRAWQNTLLEPLLAEKSALYFVHSFIAKPTLETDILADCVYGGHSLCAAVQRNNIMATQFHPEKSGKAGLAIIRQFMEV
ncbi:MAG: imidazole glycerol phosphate synthase subunit HisH [Legionellaceae bacterium]|nr:imidazole glycerol phosphate synthase subunit HisH [Legionellaceae bacterium]